MNNITKNEATPDNEDYSTKGTTWAEANFTWEEGGGTWNNPYSIGNETKNTAIPTNETKS